MAANQRLANQAIFVSHLQVSCVLPLSCCAYREVADGQHHSLWLRPGTILLLHHAAPAPALPHPPEREALPAKTKSPSLKDAAAKHYIEAEVIRNWEPPTTASQFSRKFVRSKLSIRECASVQI